MNTLKLIMIFLLCSSALKSNAQINSKNSITVICNNNKELIFANYKDIFGDFIKIKFTNIFDNKLVSKINTDSPLLLEFNGMSNQYPVYSLPGDTILISTSSQGRYYKFSSNKGIYNRINFLNYLDSLGYGVGSPDFSNRRFNFNNYDSSINFANDNYKTRLSILRNYTEQYHLDSQTTTFMEYLIKERYVQALLNPFIMPVLESRHDLFPSNYADFLNKSPLRELLSQQDRVNYSTHRALLVSYVRFLSRDSLFTRNELTTSYKNASDSLHGNARDYALFFLLKSAIINGSDGINKVYNKFHQDCLNREYTIYVDSIHGLFRGEVTKPTILSTLLTDSTGHTTTWGAILSKNKGQVIYIDFWASWCGPCLEQIPYSKKVAATLASQPVNFLYLSIDDDINRWRKAIQKHRLAEDRNQHYIVSSKSALALYLQVPPIPHYVLINRAGELVQFDAPRPDNPATLQKLLDLLK